MSLLYTKASPQAQQRNIHIIIVIVNVKQELMQIFLKIAKYYPKVARRKRSKY